jgi:hypothetical protein
MFKEAPEGGEGRARQRESEPREEQRKKVHQKHYFLYFALFIYSFTLGGNIRHIVSLWHIRVRARAERNDESSRKKTNAKFMRNEGKTRRIPDRVAVESFWPMRRREL